MQACHATGCSFSHTNIDLHLRDLAEGPERRARGRACPTMEGDGWRGFPTVSDRLSTLSLSLPSSPHVTH